MYHAFFFPVFLAQKRLCKLQASCQIKLPFLPQFSDSVLLLFLFSPHFMQVTSSRNMLGLGGISDKECLSDNAAREESLKFYIILADFMYPSCDIV